jgi:hypothetical protein
MTNGGCHDDPKPEVRRVVAKKRAAVRKVKPSKPSQTTAR